MSVSFRYYENKGFKRLEAMTIEYRLATTGLCSSGLVTFGLVTPGLGTLGLGTFRLGTPSQGTPQARKAQGLVHWFPRMGISLLDPLRVDHSSTGH